MSARTTSVSYRVASYSACAELTSAARTSPRGLRSRHPGPGHRCRPRHEGELILIQLQWTPLTSSLSQSPGPPQVPRLRRPPRQRCRSLDRLRAPPAPWCSRLAPAPRRRLKRFLSQPLESLLCGPRSSVVVGWCVDGRSEERWQGGSGGLWQGSASFTRIPGCSFLTESSLPRVLRAPCESTTCTAWRAPAKLRPRGEWMSRRDEDELYSNSM